MQNHIAGCNRDILIEFIFLRWIVVFRLVQMRLPINLRRVILIHGLLLS
jgi:hypothetical protein